ncbi:hypothetical protein [Micromonospora sp. NPDC005203]|uniref:hypothetical protein n=1 Tax=Micromonospora sp. NPDC005203 TaxID=3364226 RepID=UPI0036C010B4
MASRPERLLRGDDAPLSASFLELFFDLAFVLALTKASDLTAAVVILGGPTLFLLGRTLFSVAIHRRLSWPRVAALFVMSGAAAVLRLPLLAVSAVATGVVLTVVVLDHAGNRSYRRIKNPD